MTIKPPVPLRLLRFLVVAVALMLCLPAAFAADGVAKDDKGEVWKFVPKVNANIRTFFEQSTATGDSRFIVQHARVSAAGYVMPWMDYFLQVDFCAMGKIKILDCFVNFVPVKGLKLQLGQSKAPFTTETMRPPFTYYFAQASTTFTPANIRAVGLRVFYDIPRTPLTAEGGVYNNTDMGDHGAWNNSMLYALRLRADLPGGLMPSLGWMSRRPGVTGVRYNQYDASLTWQYRRVFLEAEYLYRHYRRGVHKPTQAFDFMADYTIPLKSRMANSLSFRGRYDGLLRYSNGERTADGTFAVTPSYRRLTLGVNAQRMFGSLRCDFMINFEQYFYNNSGVRRTPSADNMLIAGVNLRF